MNENNHWAVNIKTDNKLKDRKYRNSNYISCYKVTLDIENWMCEWIIIVYILITTINNVIIRYNILSNN